jgi:tetratricopeptide (TPR) repeat protein
VTANCEIGDDTEVRTALERIAKLVDSSCDEGNIEGLKTALGLIDRYIKNRKYEDQVALLQYFAANAWAGIRKTLRSENELTWNWEQEELQEEVLCLRLAIQDPSFSTLPPVRRCQVATNLGNALSVIGRGIEAIEFWNRAIEIDSTFAMALGNRGEAFYYYAYTLYDRHHQHILLRQAVIDLRSALANDISAKPAKHFRCLDRLISKHLGENYIEQGDDLDSFSLGDTSEENKYRTWCLDQTLFLNPLNDLCKSAVAARDVFSCPSITVRGSRGPCHHGFFNQMKQEFVSARYFYFDGINSTKPHFSDREVLLHNTFDSPSYSLAVEKIKMAFRSAYSLFDKIAFFVNDYFELKIRHDAVKFQTLWYEKQYVKNGLRGEFTNRANWPMRGLFALSKDLYTYNDEFQNAMEPDARALRSIRNHSEHKYLKLHEYLSQDILAANDTSGLRDDLAYSMTRNDFQLKTLRLLKIARAAIIYLSLGVESEERRRKSASNEKVITLPLEMGVIRDEDKY